MFTKLTTLRTIEESGAKPNVPLDEQARRCDLILAGK